MDNRINNTSKSLGDYVVIKLAIVRANSFIKLRSTLRKKILEDFALIKYH